MLLLLLLALRRRQQQLPFWSFGLSIQLKPSRHRGIRTSRRSRSSRSRRKRSRRSPQLEPLRSVLELREIQATKCYEISSQNSCGLIADLSRLCQTDLRSLSLSVSLSGEICGHLMKPININARCDLLIFCPFAALQLMHFVDLLIRGCTWCDRRSAMGDRRWAIGDEDISFLTLSSPAEETKKQNKIQRDRDGDGDGDGGKSGMKKHSAYKT